MTTKTKRILSIALIVLPALVLIIGGIMKLMDAEPEPVMLFLSKMGFGNCIKILGLTELVIAALILFPKTTKIGFLLATGYFGGTLSLEISGGQFPASCIFLTVLWFGMFLRNREVFLIQK